MILYSCWSELMKVVEVATRKPVVEESILEDLLQTLSDLKVPISRDEIKRVDRSSCENATSWHLLV